MFGQVKGQAEQRRPETFIDQHGREYFANIEISTGDPCEVLQPRGWMAPTAPSWFLGLLMPPMDDVRVVKMVPRLQRAAKRYQVEIDYRAWLDQIERRNEEWEDRLRDLAKSMTNGMNALEVVQNPPPALIHYIGPRPFPPRIFIEAMAAGNEWALGLSDKIPKAAHALLAEIESTITRKRSRRAENRLMTDPLADEDEEEAEPFGFGQAAELDPFGDEEEEFDREAIGTQQAKPVPVKPKKQPKRRQSAGAGT